MRFLALPLLLAPAFAAAQEAPITVTGRGLDERPGDAASATVTIDRARIADNAAARFESVLADAAGLQQFRRSDSRSANPTSQGISLRGIGGNASSRALLILDGVPQADPFGGWVPFPAYATDRLGQIRVTRGGGSGYFGPGALAGTVELESASPADLPPVTGRLSYGSRESVDAQGSATLARGRGFATLSGAYARGDGFVPIVAANRGPADRGAPYEQASVAARAVVATGDTEIQANLSAFTDSRERGTAFTANRSEGADASLRLVGRGRWGWSALGYVQTRGFASQFASVPAGRVSATQTLDQYNVPATGLGARVELRPPLGDAIDLRLGADWRDVSGRTQENYSFTAGAPTRRRIAGGNSRTVGTFADASLTAGDWTLTLGGRVDWWRIAGGFLRESPLIGTGAVTDTSFADRSGSEATGRAGVAWQVLPAVRLRASGYRGWRLPTLNELYRPFRVGNDSTAPNAALTPERLTGVDGGVTLTPLPRLSLGATLFWNRLDGAIANVTVSQTATAVNRIRRNLDAIRSTGVELDADWHVGDLYTRASWSHVAPRVEAGGGAAALDGLRPAQTPLDQVSGTLGWRRDRWSASATVRHVARQYDDDQNSRILAPATTLDAALTLPLTRNVSVEARAENLTDTTVEAAITGADIVERATPRTLWIGLRWR